MTGKKIQQFRYASRILGGIASVFYFYIAFKGGLIEVMKGEGDGRIQFFPFLAIAVAGYMVAYVQERKGGYLMLAGGIGLLGFFMVISGGADWMRAGAFGLPFILSGAGFVYCRKEEINN